MEHSSGRPPHGHGKASASTESATSSVRVGGFVIHGNSVATLGRCLDGLLAVSDEVLAVDSESSDGSRELALARGARSIVHPWEGYGAARAVAARALAHCDYLFFLDSDEWLEPAAIAALARWRASAPTSPHYTLRRRDWAEAGGRRFLFRAETRARLVRRDCATWQPSWIVHEALPRREARPVGACVEHAFAEDPEAVARKQSVYAFLWAVRVHGEGRRARSSFGRGAASLLRDGVVKGAIFRGGAAGWRLARAVSRYHELKYRYLDALERGAFAEAARAFAGGRYSELFRMTAAGAPPLD